MVATAFEQHTASTIAYQSITAYTYVSSQKNHELAHHPSNPSTERRAWMVYQKLMWHVQYSGLNNTIQD